MIFQSVQVLKVAKHIKLIIDGCIDMIGNRPTIWSSYCSSALCTDNHSILSAEWNGAALYLLCEGNPLSDKFCDLDENNTMLLWNWYYDISWTFRKNASIKVSHPLHYWVRGDGGHVYSAITWIVLYGTLESRVLRLKGWVDWIFQFINPWWRS